MVNNSALFTNSQDSQVERCPMLHSPWIRNPAPTGIGVLVSSTIKQSHPGCRQVLNNNPYVFMCGLRCYWLSWSRIHERTILLKFCSGIVVLLTSRSVLNPDSSDPYVFMCGLRCYWLSWSLIHERTILLKLCSGIVVLLTSRSVINFPSPHN
jgi:hypothetical protein